MGNLATISNATFTTACGLVPGPFGPLTRKGSLEEADRFTPNSQQLIEVYSTAIGDVAATNFYISYEQLTDEAETEKVLREAFGIQYNFYDVQQFLTIANAVAQTFDVLTATAEEYEAVARLFQYFTKLRNLVPAMGWAELGNSNVNRAYFTLSSPSTADIRRLTNASTGYHIDTYVIDWGDDTVEYFEAPITTKDHTYTVDGTYVITLYVMGRGGQDSFYRSEVVNVP
jgi:hypothetical protein